MRGVVKVGVLALVLFAPAAAYAQGSIVGQVRDTSGAVLPGVTVEAASPALIEKVRSAVTDGTGQYRIVDLQSGVYDVTFTLPGFAVVRREGIELAGTFTATVNAELRVGTLEETVTVTGESPVVDVQSTGQQRVIDREIIDTIPSSRSEYNLGVLIPGVTLSGGQDVGGSGGQTAFPSMGIHGSKAQDLVQAVRGMSISVLTTGSHQPVRVNPAATEEITVDTAGGSAEYAVGGVRINRIPREGGNTFNGVVFGTFANGSMQGDNLTQDLRDRGLRTPDSIDDNYEVNAGFGGPIVRDRLWFYAAGMTRRASMVVAGLFWNKNFNNPNAWTYEPDLGRPATNERHQHDGHLRLTWQVTPRNKFGLTYHDAKLCYCPQNASITSALEAEDERSYPIRRIATVDWTTPLTNRLLIEANAGGIHSISDNFPIAGLSPAMIEVEEQSTGMTYRGGSGYRHRPEWVLNFRGVTSYITGAHAFKVGMTHRSGGQTENRFDVNPLSYRFRNGVPNRLTQRALPVDILTNVDRDIGVFAQDKWTAERLTLGMGIRYDYYTNSYPEQHIGPALLAPTRNITFPATKGSTYHDITPRLGAAYDLFGTGKTALKVSVNRYVAALGSGGFTSTFSSNPTDNLIVSTTRSWRDGNRDFVPDCDLTNPAPNGECGPMANANFGGVGLGRGRIGRGGGAEFDPDLMRGWYRREYNWEISAGVQQELLPRVAAEIGYFRRSYGNFRVTNNRATTPADFDEFSVTAPVDPRLPGGGGYVISGLYDLKPEKFGQVDDLVTRARNFGDQIEYWQGLDFTINARPRTGVLLQGGVSTGRTVTDDCEVRANLDNPSPLYCRVTEPFLTQVKFLGSYTIPRVDVQVSAAFQSLPGPQIRATHQFLNADIRPSLGRNLAGGARNVTVNLIEPGTLYGERLNQFDLRFTKLLRVANTRTRLSVDLFNALNSNAVLAENSSFGRFRQPSEILLARFVKLGVQFDF